MRCISCLLSETSNCIQLMQGKTLPPEVNQVLQKLKYALNTITQCFSDYSGSSSHQTKLPVSLENDTTKPNFGCPCLPRVEECLETSQTDVLRWNQNEDEEHLKEILVFSFQRFKLLVDQLVQEQKDQEAYCVFDEEQYNFSVQTKSNQALKLLKTMKTIIKELNLITFFKNSAENRKVFEKSQEKTTNCQTTIGRSSARSLLTEKLKNFYEKTGEENVISSHQGKFIIKQNWNFNRELSKERISEPLNSISNISDVDSESFGAYSLNYPRLPSKGKRDSEDHDNHAYHENQRQRDIFNEVLLRDRKRAEIPMSRNDNGCSKCQIY